MSFQWTVPNRSIGCRPLDIIPAEIYFKIFDSIESDLSADRPEILNTLLSLTTVCHLFYSTALARIFSSIEINCDDLKRRSEQSKRSKWSQHFYTLCREIQENKPSSQRLSHLPKAATLEEFQYPNHGISIGDMKTFKVIMQGLKGMPLRRLNLGYDDLDSEIIRLLCSLPITSLDLYGCPFHHDLPVESLKGMQLRGLEHLTLRSAYGGHSYDAVILDSILEFSRLKSLVLENSNPFINNTIVSKLNALEDPTILQSLTLPRLTNNSTFAQLFQRHKNLKYLDISPSVPASDEDIVDIRWRIAANHLERLECLQDYIYLLVPQDRLVSLRISPGTNTFIPFSSFDERFSNCWGQLRELRLPFYIYAENPISSICPMVVKLELGVWDEKYGPEWRSVILKLAPFNSVSELSVMGVVFPVIDGEEDEFLQALPTAFPHIQRFWTYFDEGWVRDRDGMWKHEGMDNKYSG